MTPPCESRTKKRKRGCSDNVDNNEHMKNLIDWLWKTRCYRSDERKWAHVAEIPKHFRPTMGQILQLDWREKNPYPGWVLMFVQGGSGWMCKLKNKKETREYKLRHKKRDPMIVRRDEFKISKKCINELLLPIEQLDDTILSIWVEIGELSATHTCDLGFLDGYIKGAVTTAEAEIPRAVTPLRMGKNYTDRKPSAFVLISTNKNTKKQWEATCQDLERIGLGVVPVLGIDGEDIPCMEQTGNKAQIAWALKGLPFILKCLNKTASECGQQDWFIIAEDSAKLSPLATIETIQLRLQNLPHGIEILQTGYCRCEDKRMTMKRLPGGMITKIIGQKLFIATRRGIKLLHHRLLKGKWNDFDTAMGELIRAKVAIGDAKPLAGSREHYSLTKKEKWQREEIPDQRTDLEFLP